MFHKPKSPRTLVSSTLNLTVLNQNILYLTHEIDDIKRLLNLLINDTKLQKQVDDFYETSPQTEQAQSVDPR